MISLCQVAQNVPQILLTNFWLLPGNTKCYFDQPALELECPIRLKPRIDTRLILHKRKCLCKWCMSTGSTVWYQPALGLLTIMWFTWHFYCEAMDRKIKVRLYLLFIQQMKLSDWQFRLGYKLPCSIMCDFRDELSSTTWDHELHLTHDVILTPDRASLWVQLLPHIPTLCLSSSYPEFGFEWVEEKVRQHFIKIRDGQYFNWWVR